MFKFIMSFFKSNPEKKILKIRDRKYKEAVEMQRNGKLREFAELVKEIEELEKEYARIVDDGP